MQLTETLSLIECQDGFWLYDTTRGMNLSMHAKTPEQAFIDALTYYQRRTKELEKACSSLRGQLDAIIEVVSRNLDEEEN